MVGLSAALLGLGGLFLESDFFGFKKGASDVFACGRGAGALPLYPGRASAALHPARGLAP